MSDDAELLRRYAATRSEPAFAALVARHVGLVYSAALRRLDGDPHRATEISQTVFIALARHAADLAQRPVLASWLHTATRHAVIDLLRAERRRHSREHHAHLLATVNSVAPSDPANDWDQLRPLLDAALDQLNETDRTLLLLRFFEQHPFAVIGTKLHLTEDAARMRTARALEKLRTHLARHGITSTATALGTALTTQTLTAAPAGLATIITTGALAGTAALTAFSLTIMTTTTKTLLAAAAVAVLALGTVVFYQTQQADAAQLALTTLLEDRDAQRLALKKLNGMVADLQRRAADVPRTAATGSTATMTTPTPPPAPAARPGVTVKAPAGWSKNGAKSESYVVGVDSVQTWGGMPSAYVESLSSTVEGGFGGMMQTTSAENFEGKRVRLSGWVKTEDANEGGGSLWMRIDGERGHPVAIDNMTNRAVKGTTDWQEASVVLDVPKGASALAYGFFVAGGGKMWVNGQMIEEVGNEVPSTNLLKKQILPTAPINLGFDPKRPNG
jgi:RNA polymerase sigma factor (sigma-70 family)